MKNIPIFWSVLKGFLSRKNMKNQHNYSYKNITFENHERSAYVICNEGNKSKHFYSELGGGKCIFYVDIPLVNEWEKLTGFPIDRRDDIIKFVAEESQKIRPLMVTILLKTKPLSLTLRKLEQPILNFIKPDK